MEYRLKQNQGESIAVPQLVFSRLDSAEENALRVALYILATGVTDPAQIAAELKLRSARTAEKLLAWWAGAGLLEAAGGTAAAPPAKPAPMTWAEIAAASRADPTVANLVECAQRTLGSSLGHKDTQILVGLYLQEGYDPEVIMLCLSYTASLGKHTVGAVRRELAAWRADGVETGEQADAHLALLEARRRRQAHVCALLQLTPEELTLGGKKAIVRWYEEYGFTDDMVDEAALQAGEKRDVWYINGILKAWYGRGLRTIHDVRGGGALQAPESRNVRVDRTASQEREDFIANALNRRHRLKRED